MNYNYYIYILVNINNKVLYVGVTNNLEKRIREHKSGTIEGFTKKYNIHKLVYYETYSDIKEAINREKQLKGWSRDKKNQIIGKNNPEWREISIK